MYERIGYQCTFIHLLEEGSKISGKDIIQFLQALGLSKREIEIYMLLAKSGIQSTSFVAKRLKMERVHTYRTFKKLQEKGFIEATLERPARFAVVPFEDLFASFINAKMAEINSLKEQKESLLASWRATSAPESEYTLAKFLVISGKKKIHSKMVSMIEESQKEVLVLTTGLGLVQEDIAGVFDEILHSAHERSVHFKIITDISQENLAVAEGINKKISAKKLSVECRHVNLNSKLFPCFLIKDGEEAILHGSSGTESSVLNLEDEGLWINDKMFVSVLNAFFVQMWQSAVDAARRIGELKTGIPLGETIVIKDSEEAWAKIAQVLETAKEDVIAITSSQGINSILENDPFAKHRNKHVSFRIMASIDLDNLDAAQKLSKNYHVKHVPINYLTMMIVDNKALFIFKSPPLSGGDSESPFYVEDTFYTDDPRTIERSSEMLNDIWKRGVEISELSSQAGMKLPTVEILSAENVSELVAKMLQSNADSVLITQSNKPIGVISTRDLLKEMVETWRDPRKTLIKDLKYTPLVVLDIGESVTDALKIMREKGLKRIAVVKNGQLVGMLTEATLGKTSMR
jgi:sugar-specific transcriptional regulator TrmB/CBS domain-containing protein